MTRPLLHASTGCTPAMREIQLLQPPSTISAPSGDLDHSRTQELGLKVRHGWGVKNGAYPGVIVTEEVGCDWLLIGALVWPCVEDSPSVKFKACLL